ncbi:MAG: carboxypeptidase regulatory-like domain-containing protein [Jatrophihabitantaceae bacterium]
MNISGIPQEESWESLANEPLDAYDGEVLTRIKQLYEQLDPVPVDLADRLQFAISLDALEVELAELQLVSGELLAARAEPTSAVKTLTFTSDSFTTTVNISSDGPDRVRIDGWIAPGGVSLVELHQGSQVRQIPADEDGRFVFTDVEHALTRFLIRPQSADALPVATPAVEI